MKKKAFLIVILALVLCLTCGMLFVACNEGGDDGGKTPGGDTPGGDTPGGDTPGGGPPPVEDDDEVDPELAAAWDAMLDDLDAVRADENEVKEFAFALEIAEKGEGEAADERIFSLVFDSVNEYIYGLAGKDGEFLKLNGFDLGHVMMTVLDDWLGLYGANIMGIVPVTADGFKSDQMVGGILLGFVPDYAHNDDAYMFELDLGEIINFIAGDGTEENPGLVKIDESLAEYAEIIGKVMGVVGNVIPGVTADTTVTELLRMIGNNYAVRICFGFADAAETAEGADLFGGLVEGFAEASEKEAVNVLNFKGKINIEGKNEKGASNAAYVVDIAVDVNPFVLLGMLDLVKGNKPLLDGMGIAEGFKLGFVDFEIGDIIAMLKDFGYIHISVDEVKSVSDPTPVKNLFTLHYDSAEGKAVLSAATNEVGGEQLAAGGVYDVQALAKVVDKLIKDAAAGAADAPAGGDKAPAHKHEADKDGYACDKNDNMVCDETGEIINIEGLIGKIVGVLAESLGIDMADVEGYLNGIGTNGIVIGFEPILDYTETLLEDLTDLTASTIRSLRGTVEELIASDSLTFKVPAKAFSYGTVTKADYVGYEDLLYNLREDDTFTNGDAYVSEITGIANADGTQVEAGDIVNVTGKGFDGETVETTGVVMYVIDGVYYVGIHTDLYANLEVLKDIVAQVDENAANAIVIPAEWPFYGVLAYKPQA